MTVGTVTTLKATENTLVTSSAHVCLGAHVYAENHVTVHLYVHMFKN